MRPAVGVVDRVAVHLQLPVHEIKDPILGDAGSGVGPGLAGAVEPEGGVAHLDDD